MKESSGNLVVRKGKKPTKRQFYEKIINYLCKRHNITIKQWRKWNYAHGQAWAESREIIICYLTTRDRFYKALHEIGHCICGRRKFWYDEEYVAEKWALRKIASYGIDPTRFEELAKLYVLGYLYKDWQQGIVDRTNVKKEVLKWLNVKPIELDGKHFKRVYRARIKHKLIDNNLQPPPIFHLKKRAKLELC